MDNSYSSIEEYSKSYESKKCDISEQLAGFDRLRISALTKAAEISPLVKEVTIGPNSPVKKEIVILDESPKKIKENIRPENLIEDKMRDEYRTTRIMKEQEIRMQETSQELFKSLIEKMVAKRAETMKRYWTKQSEECERKALEIKARKLLLLKQLRENNNVSMLERAKLDEQKSLMINKQTIENMNRILEEQNKATARFASITDSHTKICITYNDITDILYSDSNAKPIYEKYQTSILSVVKNITVIMDMCKSGNITDKEVQQAQVLTINIDNLRDKIVQDINVIKKIQEEKEQKKKDEEAAKRKEIEEKLAQEAKLTNLPQNTTVPQVDSKRSAPMFYSPKNYSYFENLRSFLEQYENQYKDLLLDDNLKKFRFDCQKAVNTPVNAISSVSGAHMKDKFDKLSKLLNGERVQVLDTYVMASQHPQGLAYCTALLAKKIVRQGDLLVSSNPEAAFPLASVTVALWSQFPEFGKLLEANFQRQCPYLVPMFLPQKEGQTDKEFYLFRGYTYSNEGVVEKQDKFLKRMSGIFRLCCAIWIARPPKFINVSNPYSIKYGWQWIASFLNLKPEPDICATLIHDFFIVCGSEFMKYYSKQFVKIIKLINNEYLPILDKIDEGGPKTRLEVFLQNVLKTGQIAPPSGVLQPNLW